MADTKISALTAATGAVTNEIPVNEGGTSKKLTVSKILALAYPVGSIYISTVSTNPNTLFGFGTWAAFGAGRVLVSLDSADVDFDVAEETGGAKTHTLTTAEMPAHTHVQDAHSHTEQGPTSASGGALTLGIDTNASGNQSTGSSTATATATNQNTGGGGAHNNVQPYIIVYMFKRTV